MIKRIKLYNVVQEVLGEVTNKSLIVKQIDAKYGLDKFRMI